MQPKYHWRHQTPSPGNAFAALPTLPSSQAPSFRRTWKIVRSEIALDTEPPTSNDGACTIMSLPATTQPPSINRYTITPNEIACVAWLDWRGHHAKFSCSYNPTKDLYSRFVIDKASIDPPVKCWYVDIRFYQGLRRTGWRVRDENGEWYMVLKIDLDEGRGWRRGKAYGKLMWAGAREEDVFMTPEEGAELGCLVGLKTVEEQRKTVEESREMIRLEAELQQVGSCFSNSEKSCLQAQNPLSGLVSLFEPVVLLLERPTKGKLIWNSKQVRERIKIVDGDVQQMREDKEDEEGKIQEKTQEQEENVQKDGTVKEQPAMGSK